MGLAQWSCFFPCFTNLQPFLDNCLVASDVFIHSVLSLFVSPGKDNHLSLLKLVRYFSREAQEGQAHAGMGYLTRCGQVMFTFFPAQPHPVFCEAPRTDWRSIKEH
jgi:hypothetical protein